MREEEKEKAWKSTVKVSLVQCMSGTENEMHHLVGEGTHLGRALQEKNNQLL